MVEDELLSMSVSPAISETRESAAELVALQRKTFLIHLYPFVSSYPLFNWILCAEILFTTPSPLSPLSPQSQVAEESKVPLARPVSIKRKKLAGNSSHLYICFPLCCAHDNSLLIIVRTYAHWPTVEQVEA